MADEFKPLTSQEKAAGAKVKKPSKDEGVAIVPVPDDAPLTIPHHWLGVPVFVWSYHDAAGKLLMKICRFNKPSDNPDKPDKDFFPLTYRQYKDGSSRWEWKGLDEPRPLYGLDRLAARPGAPVLVCEGEKSADAAQKIFPDHVAITSPNGAGSPHKADWNPVAGRQLIIWADQDENGKNYDASVTQLALTASALSVHIVQVPKSFPDGWDLADPLPDGVTPDDLRQLLNDAAPELSGDGVDPAVNDDDAAHDLAEIFAAAERMALFDNAIILISP